jgi:hypothetical protein
MIRLLTDEDFNHLMLAGVRRRLPELDIVRVQDCGLRSFRDPLILEFAANEDRIVISHDVNTMGAHARARLLAGKHMRGLFLIRQTFPIGRAIEEIVTVAVCSDDRDWQNLIVHLPL